MSSPVPTTHTVGHVQRGACSADVHSRYGVDVRQAYTVALSTQRACAGIGGDASATGTPHARRTPSTHTAVHARNQCSSPSARLPTPASNADIAVALLPLLGEALGAHRTLPAGM